MLKLLNLNQVALDQIVDRVLMLQEANRLGLKTTPAEIADVIHRIPAFQKNGVFDFNQYEALLSRNNLTSEVFEKDQGEALVLQKLQDMIMEGVTVTEADAKQWYDWQNTQINLNYLLFAPDHYKDISLSDDDIGAYFKEHQNDYRTDPQVKVTLFVFRS